MKLAIAAAVVVAGLAGLGIYLDQGSMLEVINETRIVEKEVVREPDWATDQEAVEAAQAVIRRKELEAEETRLQGQIEALESELEAVQRELGTF